MLVRTAGLQDVAVLEALYNGAVLLFQSLQRHLEEIQRVGCCNENGELAVLSAVDVGSLRPGLVRAVGCQMPLRAEEAEDGESVSRRLDCAGGWGGGYTALR